MSFTDRNPGRLCRSRIAAAAASALALTAVAPALAADTVDGYAYELHTARPPAGAFDTDPSELRVTTSYVRQGPRHTLMGYNSADFGLDSATLAGGERRMGLFVPHWDEARSAAEADGWESYGDPVAYKRFEVTVEPGERDREIAGHQAGHHVLKADIVSRMGGDSADTGEQLTSHVWVLDDKPFSFAPFAVDGAYADPRLTRALVERLGKLGMVVRVETTYTRQAQDEDGAELGHPHESTHLAWVTDLAPAQVADVRIPTVDRETLDKLRTASRENPAATCETVLAGKTPDFASASLDEAQQEAFLPQLAKRCERRKQRDR